MITEREHGTEVSGSMMMEAVLLTARIILENGGETYRVEDTVERMGRPSDVRRWRFLPCPAACSSPWLSLTVRKKRPSSASAAGART